MKMKNESTCYYALNAVAVLAALFCVIPEFAYAATDTIEPLTTPLQKLQNTFSGPIALSCSLIGGVSAGGMLVFGGEINEFGRRAVYLVLVISVLIGLNSFIDALWTRPGAVL